jgi:cytochrome c biogenesis protein CcdA
MFWLRPKLGIKPKAKNKKTWRRKARPTELFVSILVIICGLALVVAPEVAPTSQFAKWIAEYGILNYAAWCLMGIVALGVMFILIGFMSKRNDTA